MLLRFILAGELAAGAVVDAALDILVDVVVVDVAKDVAADGITGAKVVFLVAKSKQLRTYSTRLA